MFGGHCSNESGDIKYLIFHENFENHVIEGSSNFMSESSSCLVIIGTMVVEIYSFNLSSDLAKPRD